MVAVPVGAASNLVGDRKLDALVRVQKLWNSHLEGEGVAVGRSIGIPHELALDVPVALPRVEGDAELDALLERQVLDLHGAREGPLLQHAVLQTDPLPVQPLAERHVVWGRLGKIQDQAPLVRERADRRTQEFGDAARDVNGLLELGEHLHHGERLPLVVREGHLLLGPAVLLTLSGATRVWRPRRHS